MVQYMRMKSVVTALCVLVASASAIAGTDGCSMDWILFGNVVVVVLCAFALAAPCVAALRSLRRRPASVLAVFAAASIVATIEAQKTNGVNNLPPMPMPPRSLPQQLRQSQGKMLREDGGSRA